MSQTSHMPFQAKPRRPDVDEKIAAAIEAARQVETVTAQRRAAVAHRAQAITAALDAGATLQELADILGVTAGRVRQLSRTE